MLLLVAAHTDYPQAYSPVTRVEQQYRMLMAMLAIRPGHTQCATINDTFKACTKAYLTRMRTCLADGWSDM